MEKTGKYSNKKEILRFIVVGLIATVIDFLTKILITSVIGNALDDVYKQLIGYTCGFTLGVIVNYVLSTFWVFKNVENKEKTKSFKSIVLFIALSLVGFGIGLGIFYGLGYAFLAADINILNFSIFKFYESLTQPEFYLYTLVFGIQTLVVLFWNYISRKKLIYKAPKEENTQK